MHYNNTTNLQNEIHENNLSIHHWNDIVHDGSPGYNNTRLPTDTKATCVSRGRNRGTTIRWIQPQSALLTIPEQITAIY